MNFIYQIVVEKLVSNSQLLTLVECRQQVIKTSIFYRTFNTCNIFFTNSLKLSEDRLFLRALFIAAHKATEEKSLLKLKFLFDLKNKQ